MTIWADYVAHMGEIRQAYTLSIGPLERDRSRWEEYIQMDLKEIRYECTDWIHTA